MDEMARRKSGRRSWNGSSLAPTFAVGGVFSMIFLATLAGAGATPITAHVGAPVKPLVTPGIVSTTTGTTDDWPMYLNSINRHSVAVGETTISVASASTLHKIWNYSTGAPIVTEATVAAGRVFFGSWNGDEYALNSTNGTYLWSTFLGNTTCGRHGFVYGLSSTATVSTHDTLYVGGGGPYWYALNARTGAVLWNVFTGNNSFTAYQGGHYNWASPLIYGGYAYIGMASACDNPLVVGGLWKLNLTTHQVVAYFNTTNQSRLGASVWASPTYDTNRGIVYIATGNYYTTKNDQNPWNYDDSLIGINVSTMTPVLHWHVPVGEDIPDGDFGATPILFQTDKGTPMVGDLNKDGRFFAFNRYNFSMGSTPAWQIQVANNYNSVADAAYDGSNLYIGAAAGTLTPGNLSHSVSGNVTNGTAVGGTLWSVNATTGKPNWDVVFPGEVFGGPVYANGVVFAAGGDIFRAIDAANGTILYSYHAPKQFYGGPSVADGKVYIGDNDGDLYVFAPRVHHTGSGGGGGGNDPLVSGVAPEFIARESTRATASPRAVPRAVLRHGN